MSELLRVNNLSKIYKTSGGSLSVRKSSVSALEGVSFSVSQGQTLGIVGESGCGKSTLGRVISRLDTPTAGEIIFKGVDIAGKSLSAMRPLRKSIQFIFQDPYASLNPRRQIGAIVEEPLRIIGVSNEERRTQAQALLRVLHIARDCFLFPLEFFKPQVGDGDHDGRQEQQHREQGRQHSEPVLSRGRKPAPPAFPPGRLCCLWRHG